MQSLKTISMRIRGYDEETEELSDDLTNITGDIADLTKTASNPEGVSLFTDETKSTYKSTYEILKEISIIYGDLEDKQQADLLEKLFGKTRAQAGAAILTNFDAAEEAIQKMEDSAGNADAEMETISNSIEYKLNALKQTWLGFIQDIGDRDFFKGIIDGLTSISEVVTGLLDSQVGLPALTGFVSALSGSLNKNLSVLGFGTKQNSVSGFATEITLFGKSLKDLFKTNSEGKFSFFSEIGKTLFKTDLADIDIDVVKQYNDEIMKGASNTEAFNKVTVSTNDATKKFLANIQSGIVNMDDLSVAMNSASIKTYAMSFALKAASFALQTVLSFAISFAASIIWTLIKNNIIDIQGHFEDLSDAAKESLQDVNSQLEDVQDQLDDLDDKINDLLKKDSLTFVEEDQLKTLTETRHELEKQNNELQRQQRLEQQSYLSAKQKEYENKYKTSDENVNNAVIQTEEAISGQGNLANALYDVMGSAVSFAEVINSLSDTSISRLSGIGYGNYFDIDEIRQDYIAYMNEMKETLGEDVYTTTDLYKEMTSDFINMAIASARIAPESDSITDALTYLFGVDKESTAMIDSVYAALDGLKDNEDIKQHVKDYVGDDLYEGIEDACEEYGVDIQDLFKGMLTDSIYKATENAESLSASQIISQYSTQKIDGDASALINPDRMNIGYFASPLTSETKATLSDFSDRTWYQDIVNAVNSLENDANIVNRVKSLVSEATYRQFLQTLNTETESSAKDILSQFWNDIYGDLPQIVESYVKEGTKEQALSLYDILNNGYFTDEDAWNQIWDALTQSKISNPQSLEEQITNKISPIISDAFKTACKNAGLDIDEVLESFYNYINYPTETDTKIRYEGQYADSDDFFANDQVFSIAYRLELQTDDGFVELDEKTVQEYIQQILNNLKESGKAVTPSNILALDQEGIPQLDGTVLSGLISGVENTTLFDADEEISQIVEDTNKEIQQALIAETIQDIASLGNGSLISNDENNKIVSFINGLNREQLTAWRESQVGNNNFEEDLQSYYKNNRSYFIDDLKDEISDGQESFSNFVTELSDSDYSILVSLDIDEGTSIDNLKKGIKDSKSAIESSNLLEYTYNGDTSISDEFSTVEETIDTYSGWLDDLNENADNTNIWEILNPTEIEAKIPGITKAINEATTDEDKFAAATSMIQSKIDETSASFVTWLNNFKELNNLTPESTALINQMIDSLSKYGQVTDPTNYQNLQDYLILNKNGTGKETIADAISDAKSNTELLQEAIDALDVDKIGSVDELLYRNYDNPVDSIDFDAILQAFPEISDEIYACQGNAESLRQVLIKTLSTSTSSLLSQLEQLKIEFPELSTEIQQVENQLQDLNNYDLNVDLSMDATQSYLDDYISKMETLASLASLVSSSYTVAFDDIREVSKVFPEVMQGATEASNGMITLNAEAVQDVINGYSAELEADKQTRIQELENQKTVIQAKKDLVDQQIEVVKAALETETLADDQAAIDKVENSSATAESLIDDGMSESEAYESVAQSMVDDTQDVTGTVAEGSQSIDQNTNTSMASATQSFWEFASKAKQYVLSLATDFQRLSSVVAGSIEGTFVDFQSSALDGASISSSGKTYSGIGNKTLSNTNSVFENRYDTSQIAATIQEIANKQKTELTTKLSNLLKSLQTQSGSYANSIQDIQTQIDLLKASGNLDDYKALLNSDNSGSDSGDSGSDSGDSAEDTAETFDWIETKISRLETMITLFSSTVSNTYDTWSERNTALGQEIDTLTAKLDVERQAYEYYLAKAESIPLSDEYKALVKSGAISVEDITDETLKQNIQDFQTWYEKALSLQTAFQSDQQALSQLYETRFNNDQSEFEELIGLLSDRATLLNTYMSRVETQGYLTSEKFYEELKKNQQEQIDEYTKERDQLIADRDAAVASGAIKLGSEAWVSMTSTIDGLNNTIAEGTNQILEYDNSIRQLAWDLNERLHTAFSNVIEDSNFYIDLMSNGTLIEDNGDFSDTGMATLGLHGLNYDTYIQEAQDYGEQIEKINAELAEDPNNTTLIDQKREYVKLQEEAISNAESEKQSIKSLISDAYDKQLESLQDLIDEYEDALDSQKDLYDYQKSVQEKAEEIASLEKQIQAYANDNSEETQQKRQTLADELASAKEELQETEYDQFISDQKDLLSDLYDDYEDLLNDRLDNIDQLIADAINSANENSSNILSTLQEQANLVGITLPETIQQVFSTYFDETNGTEAKNLATFSGNFDTFANTTFSQAMQSIISSINGLKGQADEEAEKDIGEATEQTPTGSIEGYNQTVNPPSTSSSTTETPSTSTETETPSTSTGTSETSGNTPQVGDKAILTGAYHYYSDAKASANAPSYNDLSGQEVEIVGYQEGTSWWGNEYAYQIKKPGTNNYGGWVALSQLSGYATGSKGIDKDQFAWTQENGSEAIIRPSDGAILTPLAKSDMVLNADATRNLWSLVNDNGLMESLTEKAGSVNTGAIRNTSINQNFENMTLVLPNVTNYQEFMTEMQHDGQFGKMVKGIALSAIGQGSDLSKYKYKF